MSRVRGCGRFAVCGCFPKRREKKKRRGKKWNKKPNVTRLLGHRVETCFDMDFHTNMETEFSFAFFFSLSLFLQPVSRSFPHSTPVSPNAKRRGTHALEAWIAPARALQKEKKKSAHFSRSVFPAPQETCSFCYPLPCQESEPLRAFCVLGRFLNFLGCSRKDPAALRESSNVSNRLTEKGGEKDDRS